MSSGPKLTEWTGKRWFVAVSREAGGETLAAAASAAREAKKRDVRSDPLVEAVLKRFPAPRSSRSPNPARPMRLRSWRQTIPTCRRFEAEDER